MSKIDNITLDDIYLFIEMYSGKNVVIPEDKKPIMDYMDLLDKIRAMDNRIAEFGSREHIIKYLIVHHSLSRYKASQAYEDAMEFYYCDSQISREALRNRMAQKVEAQINAALLMANTAKDFIAAIKLWKDVFQMLGLDKEDPPKLNAEAAGKMVALYSYDFKTLGLESVVDKNRVKEFIETSPLTEREKEIAMRESLILPQKLFPTEHENLRKSE